MSLLLTSALPLLAEDDVPVPSGGDAAKVLRGEETSETAFRTELWDDVTVRDSENYQLPVCLTPYRSDLLLDFVSDDPRLAGGNITSKSDLRTRKRERPALTSSDADRTPSTDQSRSVTSEANIHLSKDAEHDSMLSGETRPNGLSTEGLSSEARGQAAVEEQHLLVDFASKSAGALILEKSPNWKGASNLLNDDRDKYAIVPCQEENKSVVVSLSEDILVKRISLANYERFSSQIKDFQIYGTQTLGQWVDLGTFHAKTGNGKQSFDLERPTWARYLKFHFLSFYGDEHYCTVSQLSAYGSTMVQGFHEHWDEGSGDEIGIGVPDDDGEGTADLLPETQHYEFHVPELDDDLCFTKLGAVCPQDLSFEKGMFYFTSPNASEFDFLSALGAASVCLSSSQMASNKSLALENRPQLPSTSTSFNHFAALRSDSSESSILAAKEDNEVGMIPRSSLLNTLGSALRIPVPEAADKMHRIKQGGSSGMHLENNDGKKMDEPGVIADASDLSHPDNRGPDETLNTETMESSSKVNPGNEEQEGPAVHVTDVAMIDDKDLVLTQLISLLPSAACLKTLKDSSLKFNRVSSRSSEGNAPNTGMEPIFKRLTDEIKHLQSSLAAHNKNVKEAHLCYQSLLLDMLVHQQSREVDFKKRLHELEHTFDIFSSWYKRASYLYSFISLGVVSTLTYVAALSKRVPRVLFFAFVVILFLSFFMKRKSVLLRYKGDDLFGGKPQDSKNDHAIFSDSENGRSGFVSSDTEDESLASPKSNTL